MKKKILLSITTQFGYHTDTYMYCKYLDKSKYDVFYVGFDGGYTLRELEDVTVLNVPVHKNKFKRYFLFLSTINKLIRKENFDILFLVSCQTTLMIRLCNLFRTSILDIRTGDVRKGENSFSNYNFKVLFTSLFFKRISIISRNLAKRIHLPVNKYHWLPLGGDLMNLPSKTLNSMRLFYIGTLQERNLFQTLEGLSIFMKSNESVKVQYDIVGSGDIDDEKKLKESIEMYNLETCVTFHGRKNHDEAMNFFRQCNVGVVYIPVSYGYTVQPTTKLYEYLLAGMPVIATNTLENKLAMNPIAGVLIDDTAESFANGLKEIWNNRNTYNSEKIKETYNDSTWENIVKFNLTPYIEEIINQQN